MAGIVTKSMYFSELSSKLATPLASEDAGGPSWSSLPNFSFAFSLELSPWSAEGRRDPTSEQVDVIVQVNQDEDEDNFDDTLKCQHDLSEANGEHGLLLFHFCKCPRNGPYIKEKEAKVELTAANAGRALVKTQEGMTAPG